MCFVSMLLMLHDRLWARPSKGTLEHARCKPQLWCWCHPQWERSSKGHSGFYNPISVTEGHSYSWYSNLALAKTGLVKRKPEQLENVCTFRCAGGTTKEPLCYIYVVFRVFFPQKTLEFLSFTQVSDINRIYAGCAKACGYMQYIHFK